MLYIQLLALLLLAFGITVAPTLFSSAPAYSRPWWQVLPTIVLIALIVLGLGRLSPALNKGLTILLVAVALIVPGIIIGLRVVTWGEQAAARREVHNALRKAMDPGHVENLAAFLREPSGPLHGLAPRPEDIDRLKPYVATLPPQQLEQHQVARHLLQGLELRPTTTTRFSQLPDESLEALCRLYVELQARTGFSPGTLSLDLRQRAQLASRVAELGLQGWRRELVTEHPAFAQLSPFYASTFEELFPQPLAPGERVLSQTLGSLPLSVLLGSSALVPPQPGAPPPEDPYGFRLSRLRELRDTLALMKSRGIGFTEEELRDADLQAFLQHLKDV